MACSVAYYVAQYLAMACLALVRNYDGIWRKYEKEFVYQQRWQMTANFYWSKKNNLFSAYCDIYDMFTGLTQCLPVRLKDLHL